MSGLIDLTNKRFSRLLVIGRSHVSKGRQVVWDCLCDCGKKTKVQGSALRSNHTKSCGCLSIEKRILTSTTHGMSGTKEYRSWLKMLSRCYNETDKSYKDYGGRGIVVEEDTWGMSFEAFYSDMGDRPNGDFSIERVDNNKGYSKSNCKWAHRTEQNNNKRDNRILDFRGSKKTVSQWAKTTGLSSQLIRDRLDKCKWAVNKALTTPKMEAFGGN